MIKVILLGSGNVAVHLSRAFEKSKNIEFIQRYSRSKNNNNFFDKSIPIIHDISRLKIADIYIIAISDDAIIEFSEQLKFNQGLVVHTAGNLPVEALQCTANKGVLYPLQTFSKDQNLNFKNIPISIETEKESDYTLLKSLAETLSDKVYSFDYQQRKHIHLAAVFANNFSNHMFKIAYDICEKQNISFEILKPLIAETANKIAKSDPQNAQTGPAKRNDKKVIENHLQQLDKNQQEIYKLVTKSIINTYQSK